MKQHNLPQGGAEWHAHRAHHFNASDAPAMLGCSPYQTRSQLLHAMHTGLRPEVDAATQRRFDDGHRYEALARPLAEAIIGEDLYPVVGSEGRLSASFDGLTMDESTAFEHKALNDDLRDCMKDQGNGCDLPKHYRVQMEQQLLVSGAERVLFMASKWAGEEVVESRHCWYASDPALRREIVAGWEQFASDLATYTPPAAAAPVVVASPVQALPAVSVQATGSISVVHNFAKFETALRDFIEHRLIREPKTDQDFADLDQQIKAMRGAEAALDAAEAQMLAQVEAVDTAAKAKAMLSKLVRDNRLMAEKLLAGEKERRRGEIVAGGVTALREHIAALNVRLGKPYMPTVAADFGGCIKGLKSLDSMEDKVAGELAWAKIEANAVADRIDANLKMLREQAGDYRTLFADAAALVLKAPEDCQAVVSARIAEHQAAEQRRAEELAEKGRARIRAEEAARADREAQARAAEERRQQEEAARAAAPPPTPAPTAAPTPAPSPVANVVPMQRPTPAPASAPTLRLGQINERIAPLSIDAAGLAALGFPHSATDKAAKLWHPHEFTDICDAMVDHINRARSMKQAA